MTGRPVIYFDMDGVLVHFDETHPKNAIMAPGGHYFLACAPDPRAIALWERLQRHPSMETAVLTRLFRGLPAALKQEQATDKLDWCRKNLDARPCALRFLCTDGSKREFLEDVLEGERRLHVLLDDDPAVLTDWENAGGTGIQYLQPARHVRPCWPRRIDPYMPIDDAARLLSVVIRNT